MLHTPVLAAEVVEWLRIRPEGTYVDATLGTGGHALEIAGRLTTGRLVGIERDPQAMEIARERLKPYERQVTLVHADFSRIGEVAEELKLPPIDGVLADLGDLQPGAGHPGTRIFLPLGRAFGYAHGSAMRRSRRKKL